MGKKAKAEPRPALEPPAGTRWRTAIQPGSITMHLAAIGMARTLDRSRLGATTAFGPAAAEPHRWREKRRRRGPAWWDD